MVMLLRDLHYDHLDRLEGHRTASLQRHGCCATCQIITETVPSVHGTELVVQSLRSHSQVSCHLYLGATPSVQAIVHQMGTFLIHLSSKLQCYHLTAWLGAVALTVLFGELSCHKSQVLQGCEKLSASIIATAARWPSMAPYRGASGLAIRVYSIPWPPSCPGALPTRCTMEGAPLLAFAVDAAIQDALWRQSHTCTR